MEDSFLMGRLCRFMVAKYPGHGSQEPFRYNGLAFTRSFSSTAAAAEALLTPTAAEEEANFFAALC